VILLVEVGDWIGHGWPPGADCAQHPRAGRWAQAEVLSQHTPLIGREKQWITGCGWVPRRGA